METASTFLFIDFGKTFTHYFLVEVASQSFHLQGPVEIPSFFFKKSSDPDSIFKAGIRQLEELTQRKLLSNGILVISAKKEQGVGVDEAIFSGGEEWRDKIDIFQAVKELNLDECLESASAHLTSLDKNFKLIDAGSSAIRFFYQHQDETKKIYSTFGTGKGAVYLLREEYSPEDILRWLPFEMEVVGLENFIANKSLFPHTLPCSERDLAIEGAVLREMLRLGKPADFFEDLHAIKILVSGASFSHNPSRSQVGLIVLDGLEVEGVSEFYLDRRQFLSCFGALIKKHPELIEKMDLKIPFEHILTTVAISGRYQAGEPLGKVLINFGFEEVQKIKVLGGEIYFIPAGNQSIELEFMLSAKCTVLGINPQDQVKGSLKCSINTGEKGFIIDARGRPLLCPRPNIEGRKTIKRWQSAFII
ncbi:hypothetical protein COY34_01115 [candidate division WWE3 bacterium CG_4_10_14_0_2_um_filter_42_8]|uniref:Uncharacterized protein n=1 Tax=candidate division WWE3 bacterium CG_4_10_14_0_2_um_filter_42_8 TaxID=1975074 RepID=A0A2M7TD27_UNCKA|nr:MAG: hypothetical protein COY34_01115 [candidate division WWE3 bacterium CG_4_10_14_0_2_um_filter_42_8]